MPEIDHFCGEAAGENMYYAANKVQILTTRFSQGTAPSGVRSPLQPGARPQANGCSSDTTESILKFYDAKFIGTELSHRMMPFLSDLNVTCGRLLAQNRRKRKRHLFFPRSDNQLPSAEQVADSSELPQLVLTAEIGPKECRRPSVDDIDIVCPQRAHRKLCTFF